MKYFYDFVFSVLTLFNYLIIIFSAQENWLSPGFLLDVFISIYLIKYIAIGVHLFGFIRFRDRSYILMNRSRLVTCFVRKFYFNSTQLTFFTRFSVENYLTRDLLSFQIITQYRCPLYSSTILEMCSYYRFNHIFVVSSWLYVTSCPVGRGLHLCVWGGWVWGFYPIICTYLRLSNLENCPLMETGGFAANYCSVNVTLFSVIILDLSINWVLCKSLKNNWCIFPDFLIWIWFVIFYLILWFVEWFAHSE